MKKSIAIKFFAFTLLVVMATACSKYEEGSKFTVLTKKSRVVNTWKVSSYTVSANGVDLSFTTGISEIEMTKDGVMKTVITAGSISSTDTGTWTFSSDKSQLILTDSSGEITIQDIIKLKKDEMKLQYEELGITYLTVLVTK
ncbi:MAG: lipocalin family protein [Crocinitomicaceae bacterium]|nr:lipocalin family protein [Crocinitomicaceae bacterium]